MGVALDHAVERLLKRDRIVVSAGLASVTLLAWIYLLGLALQMDMEGGMSSMAMLRPWTMFDAVMV